VGFSWLLPTPLRTCKRTYRHGSTGAVRMRLRCWLLFTRPLEIMIAATAEEGHRQMVLYSTLYFSSKQIRWI